MVHLTAPSEGHTIASKKLRSVYLTVPNVTIYNLIWLLQSSEKYSYIKSAFINLTTGQNLIYIVAEHCISLLQWFCTYHNLLYIRILLYTSSSLFINIISATKLTSCKSNVCGRLQIPPATFSCCHSKINTLLSPV